LQWVHQLLHHEASCRQLLIAHEANRFCSF
jgi:hypothetical protein